MEIDRQINERCLQMTRDELQQKSGADFDKCYVGNAVVAHTEAMAKLEVIAKQTQGALAQVAQQAQPIVQQHLDHAKQLAKQLEGQPAATATREQRDATRTE
jgi:predicted outer membrane protein